MNKPNNFKAHNNDHVIMLSGFTTQLNENETIYKLLNLYSNDKINKSKIIKWEKNGGNRVK